ARRLRALLVDARSTAELRRRQRFYNRSRPLRRRKYFACTIPGHAPAVSIEGHAADRLAFKPEHTGRYFQSHPLPTRRQCADEGSTHAGNVVSSPVSVVPHAPVVPLQHHFTRQVRRIQIHITEQL